MVEGGLSSGFPKPLLASMQYWFVTGDPSNMLIIVRDPDLKMLVYDNHQ